VIVAQGRAAEAETLLRDGITMLSQRTGRRKTDVSLLRIALATQLATMGRKAEAVAELTVAVDSLARSAGPDHLATRAAQRKLEQLRSETVVTDTPR